MPTITPPITLLAADAPLAGGAWDGNVQIAGSAENGQASALTYDATSGLGLDTQDGIADDAALLDTNAAGEEIVTLTFASPAYDVTIDLDAMGADERVAFTIYDENGVLLDTLVYGPAQGVAQGAELIRFTIDTTDANGAPLGRIDISTAPAENGATSAFGLQQVTYTVETAPGPDGDPELTPGVDGVYQAEDAEIDGVGIAVKTVQSGYNGTGYVDYDGQVDAGESITWVVDAGEGGDFLLTWRYAIAKGQRAHELEINGEVVDPALNFTKTGSWTTWGDIAAAVELEAGANTIKLTSAGDSGANIDELTVAEIADEPLDVKINFQKSGKPTPEGYQVDSGEAYDAYRGYGWVTEDSAGGTSAIPLDLTDYARSRGSADLADADIRLSSLMHFEGASGDGAWEYAVENGRYAVTISVGDKFTDSAHLLNVEGVEALPTFVADDLQLWEATTAIVDVTDGKITIDSIGGDNTKINYVHIQELSQDPSPEILDTTPTAREGEVSINTSIAFDVSLIAPNGNVDADSLNSATVFLYNTRTGEKVTGLSNTTGGGDSISFVPDQSLDPNTNYTVVVDGAYDISGRRFDTYTSTFTTGEAPDAPSSTEIMFTAETAATGQRATSIAISPDGQYLYATTIRGQLIRWEIDAETGELTNKQVDATYLDQRTFIGLEFDPTDPEKLWITSNTPVGPAGEDFTSEIWTVDVPTGSAFTPTYETFAYGLPRSLKDHLANSLEFGSDGYLYMTMGSNSATGEADAGWAYRDERLLAGTVLKIDTSQTPPAGGWNVQTDVQDYDPTTEGDQHTPVSERNADGSVPGYYNPFAEGAVITIYGEGVRNAYDLVWHSNGHLYVPTNGSAAGGNTPEDPTQAGDQALVGAPTLNDYLFDVVEGGYYGHPNELLGHYILNGGNPTAGVDPGEVLDDPEKNKEGYDVGVLPDPDYQGFAWDFGAKISPNGVVEYQNGVLSGALLVAEYSQSDSIRVLRVDPVTGEISQGDEVLLDENGQLLRFGNPLDVTTDARNGNVYVSAFNATETDPPRIVLLRPVDDVTPIDGAVVSLGADQTNFESDGVMTFDILVDDALKNDSGIDVTLRFKNVDAFHGQDFTVDGATLDGSDLLLTVTIPAGQASTTVDVTLFDRLGVSPDRGFEVEIDDVSGSNATIDATADTAAGAITDDDVAAPPPGGGDQILYRVNLGGDEVAAIDGGPNWSADNNDSISPYNTGEYYRGVNTEFAYDLSLIDDTVIPAEVFDTEQYDKKNTPEVLSYSFPVEVGEEYLINLYVAENKTTLNEGNIRRFDVSVEGVVPAEFDDINPFEDAGATYTAVKYSYTVTAGDTSLDLATIVDKKNPFLNAIEVIKIGDGAPASGGDITIDNPLQLVVQNPRLVFNELETEQLGNKTYIDNQEATFTIRNDGDADLNITSLTFGQGAASPFSFVDPNDASPVTLGAGETIDIEILFDGDVAADPYLAFDALTIASDDADEPTVTVDLAGYWQPQPESGHEISVIENGQLFGFGTDFGAPDQIEDEGNEFKVIGDEALSLTWTQADASKPIEITQIGSWTGPREYNVSIYDPDTLAETFLFTSEKKESQTVLPLGNNSTEVAGASFDAAEPFGFVLEYNGDQDFSDPQYNPNGDHLLKFYVAKDEFGQVIDDTYIMLQDYKSLNDDYNDNIYVISNIDPFYV